MHATCIDVWDGGALVPACQPASGVWEWRGDAI